MLQKNILDGGPTLSGGLAFQHQVHLNHGIMNYQDLKYSRLDRQFSSVCSFHSTTSSGNQMIQFLAKSKGNQAKHPIFLAKLQGENESNIWKISACNGTPNASVQNSATNLYRKSVNVKSGESSCKPEEGSNSLLPHSQGISEFPVNHLVNLLDKLKAVRFLLLASEHWNASQLKLCHRTYSASATNLTHYLPLQDLDVQQLKEDLSSVGLLHLESVNSYILASIDSGVLVLENLIPNRVRAKQKASLVEKREHIITEEAGNVEEFTVRAMKKRASLYESALFGPSHGVRAAHIMVTVGREIMLNEMLMTNLLKAGADVIRINCAHDDPSVWSEIIRIARHSSQLLQKPCRVLMDLAGPKLRTGLLKMDQSAIAVSPTKDAKGVMISPARVWLCCIGSSPPVGLPVDAVLCVEQKFLNKIKVGSVLSFVDARGKKRSLKFRKGSPVINESGFIVECSKTAYIGLETKLYVRRNPNKPMVGRVVELPAVEQFIVLNPGDSLTISRSSYSLTHKTLDSPTVTCTSDRLFDFVKLGEPIAFDDGKIWGEIREKNDDEIVVSITHASGINGSRLESGKSINTPRSEVLIKGLTPKDFKDLDFVAANADMVGISFVRDAGDVVTIQRELEKRMLRKLGIVLKIETRDAFENLPLLLFQAMRSSNPLGVMVARGDLMVECGWEKMAAVQEEILSVCNAAQVPVIWATRVLETLIKSGLPTRAEISDVISGMRASCVMLNKGEHIVEGVTALDSIMSNDAAKNKKKRLLDPSSCLNQ